MSPPRRRLLRPRRHRGWRTVKTNAATRTGNGAPSWREVRVDDWAARGYAPRESNYQRGGYGQGFVQNFW